MAIQKGSKSKIDENPFKGLPESLRYSQVYKLFILENTGHESLNSAELDYLYSIRGGELNGLPLMSGYIRSRCILDKIDTEGTVISYTFILESEKVKSENGKPFKVIHHDTVSCRHYITRRMLLLELKEGIDYPGIIKAISLIPHSVKMKIVQNNSFSYCVPMFRSMPLQGITLDILRSIIPTIMYSEPSIHEGEANSLKVLKSFPDETGGEARQKLIPVKKGNGKKIEFKFTDSYGETQRLIIRQSAEIISTVRLSDEVLGEVTVLIQIVNWHGDKVDLLSSFEEYVEEYFDILHRDMPDDTKVRQKNLIYGEMIELLRRIHKIAKSECKLKGSYLLINANMLIKLCSTELSEGWSFEELEEELIEFEHLTNFLRVYARRRYNLLLDDDQVKKRFDIVFNIVKLSRDEIAVLDNFYRLMSKKNRGDI